MCRACTNQRRPAHQPAQVHSSQVLEYTHVKHPRVCVFEFQRFNFQS
jgi:hypothetical protein